MCCGTLSETNIQHPKMEGILYVSFLLGQFRPIFRGELAVSFRECIPYYPVIYIYIGDKILSIYIGHRDYDKP